MTTRKDAPFVVSSLGRVQGGQLSRDNNPSRESLTSHPLLSPPPTSTGSGNNSAADINNLRAPATTVSSPQPLSGSPTESSSPKYVPYTPRHRVSTSQVTAQPSPPTAGAAGSATPQLQLQNLRAAAQDAQLTAGSVGWAICEKLYQEGEGTDWEDIWSAVTSNRATLLLPLDQTIPNENITPDYVRDHIVYCTGPTNRNIPVVTLSGLRGSISDNTLTFRSFIAPTSPQFQSLTAIASRMSALAALPPLPSPLVAPLKPEYPVFNVPAPHTELPFPSQPQRKPQNKPVLPSARLNPFASLFGARASPATTPSPLPPATPVEETESKPQTVDVSAYVIQGRIQRKDVLRGIASSVKAELREALTGLPSWMVERTIAFTNSLHPPIPGEVKKPVARQTLKITIPEPDMTNQETASESFQAFYSSLEEELLSKEAANSADQQTNAHDPAAEERRHLMVERVERAICALFYDRLFRQKSSDDASHDAALSSRIAALNMLDLGLEHLGIDVGKAGTQVMAVVTSVGQVLQGLEDASCRAPVDKAAIIVAAHNSAVEGLSKLPPIRLKPDDEMVDSEPTPMASQFKPMSPKPSHALDSSLSTLPEESSAQPSREASEAALEDKTAPAPESSPSEDAKSSKTPVASDILLPFIIYAVVKANPPELVSHLLYTQRYRMRSGQGGEEGFCLINLLAVVEFLENVDLAALGLADNSRVLSVADLSPLPLSPNAAIFHSDGPGGSPTSPLSAAARLRGRVNQQVEELAGSANKVFTDVVDSSFSAIKGLLSVNNGNEGGAGAAAGNIAEKQSPLTAQIAEVAPWNYQRPGFGLLRRGTEFTIASVTSTLPALHRVTTGGSRRGANAEESGQMLLEVPSRPGSIKVGYESGESDGGTDEESEDEESEAHSEGENQAGMPDRAPSATGARSDARSIRSFTSMMSGESRDKKTAHANASGRSERMSLSDRLANVSVRSRIPRDSSPLHAQSPASKRASLLGVASALPPSSRPSSPSPSMRIAPPVERFLECEPGDLRLAEVGELLLEYRRVVEGLRALHGFED